MPLFLGDKGLRDADFFIALDHDWANLLLAWRGSGSPTTRRSSSSGCRFRPLDLLVSRLPKSVDLIGKMHGAVCVGTLGEGTIGGRRVRRYMYQITSHDEAYEKYGVQGTGWQTGVPAGCAGIMLARGQVPGHGVFAPEQIDPRAVPRADDQARHAVGRGGPAGGRGTAGLSRGESGRRVPERRTGARRPGMRA